MLGMVLGFRYLWLSPKIGCGSAMSIKQVCCHCAHLSLSLLFRYRCVRKVDAKGGI